MNGAKAISLAPEKCNPTRKVAASYTQEELFVLVGKVIFGHTVIDFVSQRRWLDEDGKSVILNVYELATNGTKFSDEFAEFLKKKLGPDPRYRKIVGVLLYD